MRIEIVGTAGRVSSWWCVRNLVVTSFFVEGVV
jgi:hypothetical protein